MVTRTLLLCACLLALPAASGLAGSSTSKARVARVVDGDTIALVSGKRVRLLQIDTPEPGTGECYSRAAGRDLRGLLPAGSRVALEADPRLDDVDAHGRLLRYVWHGGRNVNLELVRRGSATVWLYRHERGRHAGRLLAAATAARKAKRGLWGACPSAVWNPYAAADTGGGAKGTSTQVAPVAGSRGGRCEPSYPGVCIPPSPPDLDCADVPHRSFRVLPPDPHRFDGRDDDGLGCESP
jgi:micrococcal nuclease